MDRIVLHRRSRLILIALLMGAIYAGFVVAFPLPPNVRPGEQAADLEILMRSSRWIAPLYVVGVVLLYVLFWRALRLVHAESQCNPGAVFGLKVLVVGTGLVFGATLILLYPITAIDVFGYVVRGRLWAIYGHSPMLVPPDAFPNDPYTALAGEFSDRLSPYGPLWELLVQVPLRLGATGMTAGVIGVKLLLLLAYLICAVLIGWYMIPGGGETRRGVSPLTALTFFAWNPLILMQGVGNGHNDLLLVMWMVVGIILWRRGKWRASALALTLATLVKLTGLLMLPLFGIALLRAEPTRRGRFTKTLTVIGICLFVTLVLYAATGPIPGVFMHVQTALFNRRGFAPASAARMVLREILPGDFAEPLPRTIARDLFVIYYARLALRLWRGKIGLVSAAYMAYFGQLLLGATFRIWYPMWLVPLAVFYLTSRTLWRTLLFDLTAELSIVNYFVVWRWLLRDWAWGREGPLGPYWNYWTIMTLLTVPWVFGIPLLGPVLMKWRDRSRFVRDLWL